MDYFIRHQQQCLQGIIQLLLTLEDLNLRTDVITTLSSIVFKMGAKVITIIIIILILSLLFIYLLFK